MPGRNRAQHELVRRLVSYVLNLIKNELEDFFAEHCKRCVPSALLLAAIARRPCPVVPPSVHDPHAHLTVTAAPSGTHIRIAARLCSTIAPLRPSRRCCTAATATLCPDRRTTF